MVPSSSPPTAADFLLPTGVTGRVELARLSRELEQAVSQLQQAAYHHQPASEVTYSRLLASLATTNGLKLDQASDRQYLLDQLSRLKTEAPLIHISFAAEPSAAFLAKLIDWLRREIHPQLLLQVGLQPSITAGCIVRTTNKLFDFSLRHHLTEQRAELVHLLGGDL